MPPSPPAILGNRLPRRELASYCIGAIGSNVIYALIATYLILFYTDHFGLKAAAVGTLFLVVRVWDAITDVAMGIIVDNTRTRWGRFRPYVLVGGFLVSLTAAACFFSPDLSEGGKLIYAYVTYILWSMAYTVCDIPYWSLTPALTEDPRDRTRVTAASRTCAQVGYWIILVGGLPLVNFFETGVFGIGEWSWRLTSLPLTDTLTALTGWRLSGWTLMGMAAGVVCFLCFVITFAGTRERHVVPRQERQTLRGVVQLFMQNAPLRYLIFACFLLEAVTTIRGTFGTYYFKYYLNREDLIPLYMAVYITPVILGCILAPAICNRIGKVNAARYGYLVTGVLTMLMWFTRDHVAGVLILSALAGFFDGVSNIGRMSCLADCVEYGEWKTGNRAEGMVFSTNVFKSKLAGAVGGALTGWLLGWVGYTANVAQTPETLRWMALFFTAILGAGAMIAILPLFKYELTEKKFAEILADLDRAKARTNAPLS